MPLRLPGRSAFARCVLAALLIGCEAASPGAAPGPQAAPALSAAAAAAPAPEVEVLELIAGGADARAELPMVVAIHGLGDRPESFAAVLEGLDRPARLVMPRGLAPFQEGYTWFPLRGDMQSDEMGRGIAVAADALAATLRRLVTTRSTRGKPIVLGFSQGGALTLALALRHPDVVGAAFPIGGWAPPWILSASGGPAAPIVALHGEADTRVPIAPTREAIATLVSRGVQAELRAYPGLGHTVGPALRRDLHELVRGALAGR